MSTTADHNSEIWFGARRQAIPRDQRRATGRQLRAAVPRSAHAALLPSRHGRDPVTLLEQSNHGRIANLAPIRYGRMIRSPFGFFRGAPSVMAPDLASLPTTGIQVQLCGDCHLQNFGWFATAERNLVFDSNDFDETVIGPWEWDVKRLAASVAIAARDCQCKPQEQQQLAMAAVSSYRRRIDEFSQLPTLEQWWARLDGPRLCDEARTQRTRRQLERTLKQASCHTVEGLMPKLTAVVDGSLRFVDRPPLIYHDPFDENFLRDIRDMFHRYRETLAEERRQLLDRFRLLDLAFKVVGVGSVGLRCAIALLVDDDQSPIILQIKEARGSIWAPFLSRREVSHHGHRIVQGQRLVQSASDLFLGWCRDDEGRDYYVRQLRDMKVSINVETMTIRELGDYAVLCGWALARAHARSGHAAEIAGYLGSGDNFDRAVGQFAVAYADRNEADYQALCRAVKSGRVIAAEESRAR